LIRDILRARQAFAEIAALDESVFPLDRAAFVLALEEYPDLEVDACLRRLDSLAAQTEVLIGLDRSPHNVLQCLNQVLFVQEGLRGNTEEYYDPRNSYLNEVLNRKLGIPISLSIIHIEVGRRLNLALRGVGFPGHFLVKLTEGERDTLIDPFGGGRVLTMKDCQELLDRVYGGSAAIQPAYFHVMDNKAIISRMLFNLKGIYYQREEQNKALSIVERILTLNPGIPSEIRDRGLLYMQTSLFARALVDLEKYMEVSIAPEDAASIRGHIRVLRRIVAAEQ
jgi:regulator of sirC expression with transglutaminase-like and TPR domain